MSSPQNFLNNPPTAKRRRLLDPFFCSWGKKEMSVGEKLYRYLQDDGGLADLVIVVDEGDGTPLKRIQAHKNVVLVSSKVFQAKLATTSWSKAGAQAEILMPTGMNENVVRTFVEFLYTQKLSDDTLTSISTYDALDLMLLADHFDIQALVFDVEGLMFERINLEDCVEIFQCTRLLDDISTSEVALDYMIKNISKVFDPDEAVEFWIFETWKAALSANYFKGVTEVKLFQTLLKWRVASNSLDREKHFKALLKLIRFPIMGKKTFMRVVVPENVLSQEETSELIRYFDGICFSTEFCTDKRNMLHAPYSSDFKDALGAVESGDVILLSDFVYHGTFELKTDNVIIQGVSGLSIIHSKNSTGLQITASNCVVQNVTISFKKLEDSNPIRAITTGVLVQGNFNELNSLVVNNAGTGVELRGSDHSKINFLKTNQTMMGIKVINGKWNQFFSCHFFSGECGIDVRGSDRNQFRCISCDTVKTNGMILFGSRNVVVGFTTKNSLHSTSIEMSGNHNTCSSIQSPSDDISVSPDSFSNSFINCRVRNILIGGFENKFETIDCTNVDIIGQNNIITNLIGSTIDMRHIGHNTVITDSNFLSTFTFYHRPNLQVLEEPNKRFKTED